MEGQILLSDTQVQLSLPSGASWRGSRTPVKGRILCTLYLGFDPMCILLRELLLNSGWDKDVTRYFKDAAFKRVCFWKANYGAMFLEGEGKFNSAQPGLQSQLLRGAFTDP